MNTGEARQKVGAERKEESTWETLKEKGSELGEKTGE